MALREELHAQGNTLFRFRSYFPLVFFVIILLAMKDFGLLKPNPILDQMWQIFCLAISILGLGIRSYTIGYVSKGTSGRNTTRQIADILNTTGIYSIVRHPLYLGNFFMWFGVIMLLHSPWLILTFILSYWLYYERIMYAEEEFLRSKFELTYLHWAEQTPAFWPKFANWKPPSLVFSWENVIKREYHGLFGVVLAFCLINFIGNYVALGSLDLDWLWDYILTVNLFIYIIIRLLVKNTRIFYVAGR